MIRVQGKKTDNSYQTSNLTHRAKSMFQLICESPLFEIRQCWLYFLWNITYLQYNLKPKSKHETPKCCPLLEERRVESNCIKNHLSGSINSENLACLLEWKRHSYLKSVLSVGWLDNNCNYGSAQGGAPNIIHVLRAGFTVQKGRWFFTAAQPGKKDECLWIESRYMKPQSPFS